MDSCSDIGIPKSLSFLQKIMGQHMGGKTLWKDIKNPIQQRKVWGNLVFKY